MKFTRLILTATGFTQDLGERTGLEIFHARLHQEFAAPLTVVPLPVAWHYGVTRLVNWIAENVDPAEARIDVIAYSYGGGVWFPKFQKQLAKLGTVGLHTVCLVDPVPRWRPFNIFRKLVIVNDAQRVRWFAQDADYPRSGGVHWTGGPAKRIYIPGVSHNRIDNHPLVHADILEALK